MKVLVVDHTGDERALLVYAVQRAGYRVLVAETGPEALQTWQAHQPEIVLLAVDLPGLDGFALCGALRQQATTPLILLSARPTEAAIVRGLDLGADDFVARPIRYPELLARIRAALRRGGLAPPRPGAPPTTATLQVGPLWLNPADHTAAYAGQPLHLTTTEFRLLHCLMRHAETLVPTRILLDQVWGSAEVGTPELVRVTVHRLRRKLEDDPRQPRLLHLIRGTGVRLTGGSNA